jgi:hypothetical protein
VVSGPDRRQTLVATVDALDRAVADLRRTDGEPAAAPVADDREPRLCPKPTKEPQTTTSANSIAYQEYVSGLRYPLAIWFGGLFFDGCDPPTGLLLEAKADIDFMFDENDELYGWIDPKRTQQSKCKTKRERRSPLAARSSGMRKPRGLSRTEEDLGPSAIARAVGRDRRLRSGLSGAVR